MRQYYVALYLQKEFELSLQQILGFLKPENNSFWLISFHKNEEGRTQDVHLSAVAKDLEKHLQALGAKLESKIISTLANLPNILGSYKEHRNIICLLTNEVEEGLIQRTIPEEATNLNKDKSIDSNDESSNQSLLRNAIFNTANISQGVDEAPHIICIMPQGENYIDAFGAVPNAQYINMDQAQNYYFLFFEILQKCYKDAELSSIIKKFRDRYDNIYSTAAHKQQNHNIQVLSQDAGTSLPKEDIDTAGHHPNIVIVNTWFTKIWSKADQVFTKYIGPLTFVSIIIVLLGFYKTLEYSTKSTSNTYLDQTVLEINEVTANVAKSCSTNNITLRDRENNHRYIKQMEQVVLQLKTQPIHEYYSNIAVLPEHLMHLLYSLCVLANYHNINDHDGTKARDVLYDAKLLAEQYIRNRSKLKLDFDALSHDRIYTEIRDFADLRELYTIIVYLIGRTYTYQGDRNKSTRYFELSKYLGTELKLFEGYLSNIGIAKTTKKEIVQAVQNKHYSDAIRKIEASIALYKRLKQDTTEYKDSFRPGFEGETEKYNKMIPANNIYNRVECAEEISRHYFLLIYIACCQNKNTENHTTRYVQEISGQFIGNHESPGILKLLPQLGAKKIACVFNTLGSILLLLHDNNINSEQFRGIIHAELNLQNQDIPELQNYNHVLTLAAQIFTLAEKQSRQSDYTKADAHHGLQAVYARILKQSDDMTEASRQNLITAITFHASERDRINKNLNRTFNVEDVFDIISR
ncbi:MAG: hypothetical protein V4485_03645 [Pseudomonadota bacterium]